MTMRGGSSGREREQVRRGEGLGEYKAGRRSARDKEFLSATYRLVHEAGCPSIHPNLLVGDLQRGMATESEDTREETRQMPRVKVRQRWKVQAAVSRKISRGVYPTEHSG